MILKTVPHTIVLKKPEFSKKFGEAEFSKKFGNFTFTPKIHKKSKTVENELEKY